MYHAEARTKVLGARAPRPHEKGASGQSQQFTGEARTDMVRVSCVVREITVRE